MKRALNRHTEESLQALEGERAEERAIVRVYILGPAALAISSQAICVFLAVWRRGGGPRYNILEKAEIEELRKEEEVKDPY